MQTRFAFQEKPILLFTSGKWRDTKFTVGLDRRLFFPPNSPPTLGQMPIHHNSVECTSTKYYKLSSCLSKMWHRQTGWKSWKISSRTWLGASRSIERTSCAHGLRRYGFILITAERDCRGFTNVTMNETCDCCHCQISLASRRFWPR